MAIVDPLARYNAKRDFAKTAEPAGALSSGYGNRFMVQKHDASRLHWDLRLEVDGVMKSWAVTRGPSLDPSDKRLAVQTEDHPVSYADFEGTIPNTEYGGGTVMLWDDGTWAPLAGKSAKDLDEGHLHFVLNGARMKGEWLLIRLKPRGKERNTNWLLRKIDDAFAGSSDALVEGALTSVKTGRTMQQIAEGLSAKNLATWTRLRNGPGYKTDAAKAAVAKPRRQRGKMKMPAFAQPQLCTLVNAVPAGSQWIHEVKYDGYRALVAIGNGTAKVYTRSGLDWTHKFPVIAAEAAKLGVKSGLIDGEIVALKDGRPDFSTLKEAISTGGPMQLFVFDLLELDGEDLTTLPNVSRKSRLQALMGDDNETLIYADHIIGEGEKLFETMCGSGYEGVVSKRADAPYRGRRTSAWLKTKCTRRQEFVIVGWTQSDRGRGFKSLLLGVHDARGLRYAGKVGTGFTQATMDELLTKLQRIERVEPTVAAPRNATRGSHWVSPDLVAEIAFAEITADGVLRHSSFLGLRGDKNAELVVIETPSNVATVNSKIIITHPERVIFDDATITKGDLAAYYLAIAPVMLPFIANRPISLVRCPQGRGKQCFFQKHDAGSFGDAVKQVEILEKDGTTEPYLYVTDADGLAQCVQMGTIEFHGWGSFTNDVEKPDRLVFDLDPDEGLGFDAVKKAAVEIKDRLAEIGLVSFAMLSGGKGVHVVVPLTPQAPWAVVKDFAERFSQALSQAEPDRFTATMSKAKRKGKIFIDWLRNQRGSTAVMPYSARTRAKGPVAAPVTWSELATIDTPAKWHVGDQAVLIERASNRSLTGWGTAAQTLPDI